ncbi:hypothetical protein KXD40_008881 [Peronospora effusa]|uniref:Uncharacterized protein n=1 Tax=Peronospora effusa TaxID=542832 RepID=A0A425C5U8_9STRA|nr:hypothetical protein DD237_001011 [Peronospora effusa]UIZ21861.1 hypothetical protein KXD40_008881 [Peronospora effusa]CAI5703680.1 unnamed protein product [Peronospora effusa]
MVTTINMILSRPNSCEFRSGMSVQELKHLTAQRQHLEFYARNPPRAVDSTSRSSSLSTSPQGYMYSFSQRGLATDKMFITCGGQEVIFMEGVVNAPKEVSN